MYPPRREILISLGISIGLVVLTLGFLGVMSRAALARPLSVDVSAPILTHTTWIITDSPYVLTSDIVVTTGVTLTIEPGVVVRGMDNTCLRVSGHLYAVGTETQSITFTSSADSEPEEWRGLAFEGGTGYLRHVTVRYGGQEYDHGGESMRGNIIVRVARCAHGDEVHPTLQQVHLQPGIRVSECTIVIVAQFSPVRVEDAHESVEVEG